MSRIELVVGQREAGKRLDALLAERTGVGSRAGAQRLIDSGAATVDGLVRPKSRRLHGGETVVVEIAETDDSRVADAPYTVVLEDQHLIVVEKPAGVVTHPAPGHHGPTLAEALAGRAAGGSDPQRAGIVHRLDRDTSGLLVVTKSEAIHGELQRMIRRREIRREYLALVSGAPDADGGTIDAPLGRDRVRRTVVSTRTDRPRPARTHFEVVERLPRTTLLRVRLETGRTHQIRAHLAAIGLPVCGDPQYGGRDCGRRLSLERQFLHSARLAFTHPATGAAVDCESKPPTDLLLSYEAARQDRPGA